MIGFVVAILACIFAVAYGAIGGILGRTYEERTKRSATVSEVILWVYLWPVMCLTDKGQIFDKEEKD